MPRTQSANQSKRYNTTNHSWPFQLAVGHRSPSCPRQYRDKMARRRRQRPSSHVPTAAAFSLLSSAALCCLLPFGQRRTTVHAWVIPKSFENVLLPNSPRTTSSQQQENLLSPPLHISTAESLILGTNGATSGREGASSVSNTEVSTAAQAASVSVPQDRLQQIETPLDRWLQDVMTSTAATIAGIMSSATANEERQDIAPQTSVQMLNKPIPSGQNQIPVIDRIAKVRETNQCIR